LPTCPKCGKEFKTKEELHADAKEKHMYSQKANARADAET
jgi:hypothetical protein